MTKPLVYEPTGVVGEAAASLARAPAQLAGARLAILDNGKPGAATLMQAISRELGSRVGSVPGALFQKGSAATPCEPELARRIESEADWVLTGTAD